MPKFVFAALAAIKILLQTNKLQNMPFPSAKYGTEESRSDSERSNIMTREYTS